MSCGKSQGFLAENDVRIKEIVDAKKRKLGRDDTLRLAHEASRVIVARGKKVVTFDMKNDPPDTETLLKHMLGPSGNLRAPTIRTGTTLLVGFHTDAYEDVFQASSVAGESRRAVSGDAEDEDSPMIE